MLTLVCRFSLFAMTLEAGTADHFDMLLPTTIPKFSYWLGGVYHPRGVQLPYLGNLPFSLGVYSGLLIFKVSGGPQGSHPHSLPSCKYQSQHRKRCARNSMETSFPNLTDNSNCFGYECPEMFPVGSARSSKPPVFGIQGTCHSQTSHCRCCYSHYSVPS